MGLVVTTLGALAVSASCTTFAEEPPQADAGAGDATPTSDAGSSDAAGGDGGCATLFDEEFASTTDWTLAGSAVPGSDAILLTPSNQDREGVAVWNKKVVPGRYEVELELEISSPGGTGGVAGDGMAVWWSDDSGLVPPMGGRNFGVCRLNRKGLAVVVDTLQSSLRVVSLGACTDLLDAVVPTGPLSGKFTLLVTADPEAVQASLKNPGGLEIAKARARVSGFETGFTGLSASTGGSYATHAVNRVTMTYCKN